MPMMITMYRKVIVFSNIIILVICSSGQLFSQDLQFTHERIELDIDNHRCCLKGTYYFKNRSALPAERMIYYPFSKEYNLCMPDSVTVTDIFSKNNVKFSKADQYILFHLFVPARGESVYEVVYCQETPRQKMEYILTTTRTWKRPLDQAKFIIKLAADLQLKYLSCSWDSMTVSPITIYYYKTWRTFMPDSNLIVEWIRR
jgi:hypothetical protein